MYRWVVFLHILGSLLFFMAHGVSAAMALQIGREQNRERIRGLMELSAAAVPVMWIGLLTLLIAGIIAGIMGNWFSFGWIWLSLALMVVLVIWMGYTVQKRYAPIRKALGITYRGQPGDNPPASDDEIASLIRAANPVSLAAGGFGLAAVILWLMIFKPF
jgi:cytochrome bd-type quinol oxidase subunit 2